MSAEADNLKPVPEQVMRQSEVFAMQALSRHVESLGQAVGDFRGDMREFRDDMREVRDKVLVFEASELKAVQAALTARVSILETERSASKGAKSLATEVRDWMPTVVMLGGMALFYFKNA